MRIDRVVVNASPLIILFKGGLEHLLPQLFVDVVIPGAVWDEVIIGEDTAAAQLPSTTWIRRIEIPTISPEILAWNLGQGESEVLSTAIIHAGYGAVLDDRAARQCAHTLGISILGTGGVLVQAKRKGLIESVSSALGVLSDAGLWLSDDLTRLLKQLAGE